MGTNNENIERNSFVTIIFGFIFDYQSETNQYEKSNSNLINRPCGNDFIFPTK